MRAIVVAVSGDFGSVEDLTQETFLRAYRGLGSLHDINKFRSWIQGIARMVAREQRRQLVRDPLLIDADDVQDVANDNACVIVKHEEHHRVMAAVAELPERERLAVHAYFFHEQNADEAAATMGISRSGFYAALDRGVKHFAATWWGVTFICQCEEREMNPTETDDRIVAASPRRTRRSTRKHGQTRAALLESLGARRRCLAANRGSTVRWRRVAGGLGLSAAAASIALALWLFSSTSPAAAMERMAKALDQINGYTYRMEKVYVSRKGEGRTVRQITLGTWRTSPTAMLATMHIGELVGTNPAAPGAAKTLVHLDESHQADSGRHRHRSPQARVLES